MYNLIFLGIVIAQFGFPVAGIPVLAVAGFGMVSYACWILSRHVPAFRSASIAAGLITLGMLMQGILPKGPDFPAFLEVLGLVLSAVFGWQLLSAISIDAKNMWHPDLASRSRMARFLYLAAIVAPPVCTPSLSQALLT